ncbi:MAG TPA: hypothetical protein VM124_03730 [Candidatus Limnocylindrales bacterium]|nr:hypothetical protein [Candidatus Limnocylindrales bacterium]
MSDISSPEMGLPVVGPAVPGLEATAMQYLDYGTSAGRLQRCLDRVLDFAADQRAGVGVVLAVLALGLAGCGSPADSKVSAPPIPAVAEAPSGTSTTLKSELNLPVRPEFRPGEQNELATAMGLEDISKAQLKVIDRYDSFGSEVVILGLNGFKPSETVQTEFKAAVGVGEALARRQANTLSASLQLGTGTAQDVKYQLQSSSAGVSQPSRRYAIFTETQQAVGTLIPENTPQGGYTKQTSKGINLSIVPDSATVYRDAFIEGFRTATSVTLDTTFKQSLEAGTTDLTNLRVANVPNPTPTQRQLVLLSILAQREAQTWADARQSARKGTTFDEYSKVTPREIVAYAKTGATAYILAKPDYIALGYPA